MGHHSFISVASITCKIVRSVLDRAILNNQPDNFTQIHDEDIPALTGLRAFAALWVFILHACFGNVNEYGFFPAFDHKLDWGIFENFLLMEGNLPVSLFFILSGFIMAHVYGRHFKKSVKPKLVFTFYIKRLARIYPVHLFITLALAGFFFADIWQPIRPFDLQSVLLSVGLLNVFKDPSANIPAWSVSAEWIAYIACPFILYVLAKIKPSKLDVLFILLLCFLYPYLFREFFCCKGTSGAGAILNVMTDFTIGCLLYRLHRNKMFVFKGQANDWICAGLFGALFLSSIWVNKLEFGHSMLPFILYYLANSAGFMKDFFASKIMVFLGVVSYCIYMVHYSILEIFTQYFSEFFYSLPADYSHLKLWLFFGFITATVLIAATILHYAIERPCRRYIVDKMN